MGLDHVHVEETLAAEELGEEVQVHVRPEGERADDLLPPGTMESTACRCGSLFGRACVGVTLWGIARRTSEGLRECRTRRICEEDRVHRKRGSCRPLEHHWGDVDVDPVPEKASLAPRKR